jgi:hypothetical protein
MIEAHDQPWASVVPGFGNANPVGALSWAIFLLDYGQWLHTLPPRETATSPTHNVAYKRQVLLDLGDGLERALTHGDQLTVLFRRERHRSYFEPAARIDHLNVARLGPWVRERFFSGILVAGRRAQRWSALRRLVYLCGSPLIPAVLLSRLRPALAMSLRRHGLPRGTIPAVIAGTIISTLGEVVGYAWGVGTSTEGGMVELELHKVRYAGRRPPA